MLKIMEAINLSSDYLEKKGIESPKINAELLLADILNLKRLDLYLSFDKPLKEEEINKYREYIKRRGEFEPLQYILGYTEFYGLKFQVNSDVLIPRQETEILVETIINDFSKKENISILDLGTGSGNIALALLKNLPNAFCTAVDVNAGSLAIAEKNTYAHELVERIKFVNANILAYNPDGITFDIIVSNPPYISQKEYKNLQKEIINFEPRIALTDEKDGLQYYHEISRKFKDKLSKNGRLYFEAGAEQAQTIKKIIEENGYTNIKLFRDYLKY